MEAAFEAGELIDSEPATYEEAMRSSEAQEWREAMVDEINSLLKMGTWQLRKRPPGARVLGSRWHLKKKRGSDGKVVRYKARLVAQGFSQRPGIDFEETFAPVARQSSLRVVLALAATEDWELDNMDVDTAFLQSPVEEELYIKQPRGFEQFDPGGEELVCQLERSIYGLKQSSRNWNQVVDTWLREYGFKPNAADQCVYVLGTAGSGRGILIIVLYVDDLVIAGSKRATVDKFKRDISARFKMKDLGALQWVLGMQVIRDRARRTLELKQTAYIDLMLARFGMQDAKYVKTPAEGELRRLLAEHGVGPDHEYMQLVGSLLYAANATRPDIAYAVHSLSRHMQAVGEEHRLAGKRVLKYLIGAKDLGIKYGARSQDGMLVGYCDADWGGDRDTRKSTTAYVFMVAGGAVSWASRLQTCTAQSSTEAEYIAASEAAKEAVYLRRLLEGLGYGQSSATKLYEDNQGCIKLAKNPVFQNRTKHIDLRIHFIREKVESGEIELVYVPTKDQIADIMTKPLAKVKFGELRCELLGYGSEK
jgi:hypothetical protein